MSATATGRVDPDDGAAMTGVDAGPGTFAPRPGRAPLTRMVANQTRMELVLMMRNAEQVMLSLIVPIGLLVVCTTVSFIEVDGDRADFFVPGILALAIMSAAFTSQAIATGFDRHYGVLKRLGATALPRSVLLGAKTLAVLAIEAMQIVVLCSVGLALGWTPSGEPLTAVLSVVALIALGTAAFCGMAFLLAGTLRAMTTLAAANIIWFVLLGVGGIAFPLSEFGGAQGLFELLPTAALSSGLRTVLADGEVVPWHLLLTLGLWAVVTLTAATATFRWE
ncbi:MAG: ABC transporter permease [Solirubrobacteraceae bacterium]|nr:ABC transporter permease [Solirubrobacteraceae bacterium]